MLDIGCGIGGPARWIAARTGCRVTGIDLTPEFVEAAGALNQATAMAGQVRCLQGSALDLPFAPASFDRAYSQNVVMNIADKPRFYAEAFRVLKPGGVLELDNGASGENGPPYFHVPWVGCPDTSRLSSCAETRADSGGAGCWLQHGRDRTHEGLHPY